MLEKDEEARKANGAFRTKEGETPQLSIEEGQAKDELRPWRGFFSPAPQRDSLFTVEADLRTAELQSWQPCITINPRWASDDDK